MLLARYATSANILVRVRSICALARLGIQAQPARLAMRGIAQSVSPNRFIVDRFTPPRGRRTVRYVARRSVQPDNYVALPTTLAHRNRRRLPARRGSRVFLRLEHVAGNDRSQRRALDRQDLQDR